jgi:hypothetical protein
MHNLTENLYSKIQQLRHQLLVNSTQNSSINYSQIDDVIVILGSSRSGSSLLYQLLCEHPEINSLPGEDIAYFRLHQLHQINSFEDDDRLLNKAINYSELANDLLKDAGSLAPHSLISTEEKVKRFMLQWPHFAITQEQLTDLFPLNLSYEKTISNLNLDLRLYENKLDKQNIEFANDRIFIEEPPFIIPKSRNFIKKNRNILLLKSSSNAYRMNHINALFPQAKFHYFLIKRNPEAVINGLLDGWNSSGFHSHHLGHLTQLSIKNYNSPNWWKFDLPPNWQNYINSDLVDVCAFQWISAYQNILQFLKNKKYESIDYDDFFTPQLAFQKINKFLSVINLPPIEKTNELPRIMSTQAPGINRWLEKKDLISPIIEREEIRHTYQKLRGF